MKYFLIRK